MPSLINRVPPGLLSLLGIKSLGQNPQFLPDTVQVTLAMERLYVSGFAAREVSSTGAFASPGFKATSLAPNPGELMVLDGICGYSLAALGAGTTLKFKIVIADNASGTPTAVLSETASGTAGEIPSCGSDRLVVVPAGSVLGIHVDQLVVGVNPNVRLEARVIRLAV